MNRKIWSRGATLFWIEPAADGTAAGAHLAGTLTRLMECRIPVRRVVASTAAGVRQTLLARLRRVLVLVLKGVLDAHAGVLVARWHPFVFPVLLAWRLRGGRSVVLVQGSLADLHAAHPWTRHVAAITLMARASLRYATRLTAVSDQLRHTIAAFSGVPLSRIDLLPNGVPLSLYDRARRRAAADPTPRRRYAVFVGNLAPWQGLRVLMEAVQHERWPAELDLVIVGDGVDYQVAGASHVRHVFWLGRVDRQRAADVLARATMALAPRLDVPASATAASPYKVFEAAAAGVPIIASSVVGQRELVAALENGILVEPGNAGAVASAVARLATDEALRRRLIHRGIENVRSHDWRVLAQQLGATLAAAVPGPVATTHSQSLIREGRVANPEDRVDTTWMTDSKA